MIEIHIGIDWERKQLTGPLINLVYPRSNGGDDVPVRFYGESAASRSISNSGSPEQKQAIVDCPVVTHVLWSELPSLIDAEDLAAYLTSLEIKFDPKNVGLPIRLAVLPISGSRF